MGESFLDYVKTPNLGPTVELYFYIVNISGESQGINFNFSSYPLTGEIVVIAFVHTNTPPERKCEMGFRFLLCCSEPRYHAN
jgi:hypothetical protein